MKKYNVLGSSVKSSILSSSAKRAFMVQNGGDLNFGVLIPYPVKNLSGSSANLSVSLSWSAPDTDFNGNVPLNYKVYRQGALIATVTTLYFNDTVTATGTYNYEVYANYSGNLLSDSRSVSVLVLNVNPARNLLLTPINGGVNISWSAPSSGTPSGYKIYRDGTLITTVTTLSYTNNVAPGTYSYSLVASYNSNTVDASEISGSVTVNNYGSGTEADPYLIYTVSDLIALKDLCNNTINATSGKFWKLMNNLDISSITANGGWVPIGKDYGSYSFCGNFNGNGKVINGLYINQSSNIRSGIFGNLKNAVVKNLSVQNASINSYQGLGIIAGALYNNSLVTNCFVQGNVVGSLYCGLLVGYVSDSTVNNCFARGNLSRVSNSSYNTFGLILGYNSGNSQSFNYAIGNVYYINGTNPTDKAIGPSNSANNFFDSELSNQLTAPVNNGLPKTTAQMKTQSTFTGWDFTNIWQLVSNINDGYPSLRIFN